MNKSKRVFYTVLKQVLLILMTLVMFFPLYIVFIMGTYYSEDIFKGLPILPGDYLMENLKTVFANHYFRAYFNSIFVSVVSVILSVFVSS